jgi:hypothetical protein
MLKGRWLHFMKRVDCDRNRMIKLREAGEKEHRGEGRDDVLRFQSRFSRPMFALGQGGVQETSRRIIVKGQHEI